MATATAKGITFNGTEDVLKALTEKKISVDEASALINALKGASNGKTTVQVADKPGKDGKPASFCYVIRIGGRFPKCFYASEWVRMMQTLPEVCEGMAALADKANFDKCDLTRDQFRLLCKKVGEAVKPAVV